jgi:flagellar basal-body rod modification protein FlgD
MSGTVQGTNGAASAATPRSAGASTGLGADFNTFLTLLTTQLRNQDPTNAMDPNEMTQQLVQFAGVEQQLRANANLASLISLQQGAQLVGAAPLMGRMVESDRLSLQGGQATLRLPPAGEARRVGIGVLDSQGRVIRVEEVNLSGTAQDWVWDGRDAEGVARPDGAYGYALQGVTATGAAAEVSATILARATAVERRGGEVQLNLGALTVAFDKLRGLSAGS